MAYVPKDHVYKVMRQKDLFRYRVIDAGRKIDEQDEPLKVEDAVSRLQETLDSLEGTYVDVILSPYAKQEKRRGGNTVKEDMQFRVSLGGSTQKIGGIADDVKKLMDEKYELLRKIDQMSFERKLDDMRREMREFQERDNDSIGSIAKAHPMLIPAIISALTGKEIPMAEPGIAGTRSSNTESGDDAGTDPDDIIDEAIERLYEVDEDLPSTLSGLADFAENNPDQYRTYKSFLTTNPKSQP